MFEINKKMMLCAAVGGEVEDYQKMINSELITLRCPHVENSIVVTSTIVNLRQLAFDRSMMGWVGRCERCGKIYYKGAIK